jgi:hypothetical protein
MLRIRLNQGQKQFVEWTADPMKITKHQEMVKLLVILIMRKTQINKLQGKVQLMHISNSCKNVYSYKMQWEMWNKFKKKMWQRRTQVHLGCKHRIQELLGWLLQLLMLLAEKEYKIRWEAFLEIRKTFVTMVIQNNRVLETYLN